MKTNPNKRPSKSVPVRVSTELFEAIQSFRALGIDGDSIADFAREGIIRGINEHLKTPVSESHKHLATKTGPRPKAKKK